MRSLMMALLLAACVGLGSAAAAGPFMNGGFEIWSGSTVADYWTGYNAGNGWAFVQALETLVHNGDYAQKIARTTSAGGPSGNKGGLWQQISANAGDALTLADAWVNCVSDSTQTRATVRVDWDGGAGNWTNADAAAIWATAGQSAGSWYEITGRPSGNAAGTSVTFYLDVRKTNNDGVSVTLDTVWDDISILQAFVPAAPVLGGASGNSLSIDVDPGGNASNAAAQFAVTVGGGAFALGSSWLQADGSVGSTPVWQTDAAWGTTTLGGLAASTAYSFKVKSRYSSLYSRETALGSAAQMSTVPEPGSMAVLLSGLSVIGFVVRRRCR